MTSLKNTLMTAFLVGMAGITGAVAQTKNSANEKTAEQKKMEAKVHPSLLSQYKKYKLTDVTSVGNRMVASFEAGNQDLEIEGEDTNGGRLDPDEVNLKRLIIKGESDVTAIELSYEKEKVFQATVVHNGAVEEGYAELTDDKNSEDYQGIQKLVARFDAEVRKPFTKDPLKIDTHVRTKAQSDARIEELIQQRKALFGLDGKPAKNPPPPPVKNPKN